MMLLYKILVITTLTVLLVFITMNSLSSHCGGISPILTTYINMSKLENRIDAYKNDCLYKFSGFNMSKSYINQLLSIKDNCFELNLRNNLFIDGFGIEMKFSNVNDSVVISSAGKDAVFGTKDDMSTLDKIYLNKKQ